MAILKSQDYMSCFYLYFSGNRNKKKMVLTEGEMLKFDDVFLGILQHCGKIEPFLDSIFYFLSRRTDFFRLMYSKNDKLGFPPGIAEKMLIKV